MGRFGLGVLTDSWRYFSLDVGGYICYLGNIESGSTQSNQLPPMDNLINRFSFKDNWIGDFYVGLKVRI